MYAWIGKKRRGAQIIEDELTSCVFGPLRTMQPAQAWKSCLALLGLDDWSPCPEPSRVDIRFWPRFKRDDGGHVEPDLHVVAWAGGQVVATILVEVKWRASLGDDQLLDQWKWISVGGESGDKLRERSHHVLASYRPIAHAEKIEEQRSRQNEGMKWGDRLVEVSWHDVARNLETEGIRLEDVETWRKDLLRFLASQGIVAFEGFQHLHIAPVGPVDWHFDDSEDYMKPVVLATGPLNWTFQENGAAT